MVGMNMAEEVGESWFGGGVLAKMVDAYVRELDYVPVEGRHRCASCLSRRLIDV